MQNNIIRINTYSNNYSKTARVSFRAFNIDGELQKLAVSGIKTREAEDIITGISSFAKSASDSVKENAIDGLFECADRNGQIVPKILYGINRIAKSSDNVQLKETTLEKVYPYLTSNNWEIVTAALSAIQDTVVKIPHKIPEVFENLYPLLDSEIRLGGRFYVREETANTFSNIIDKCRIDPDLQNKLGKLLEEKLKINGELYVHESLTRTLMRLPYYNPTVMPVIPVTPNSPPQLIWWR